MSTTESAHGRKPAFHAMMFLSGMGALVFEVVWFNQIGLIVGNSVWSAALVVGAFMAGLALGNGLAIRLARRWTNLVQAYGAMESVAALSGVAVVLAFPVLPVLLRPLLAPFLDQGAPLNALRLAIAFGWMAIPAAALGTSLPLLSKPLEQASGSYGYALGTLYGVNTLGAVAGTLLAELVLVPHFGLRGSGLFAAACNLSAALIAVRVARAGLFGATPVAPPRIALPSRARRSLLAAFLAGGVLLALEVIWFRLLLLFQTGTTLMFAVMLAVVLAFVALGGIAAPVASRRGWRPGVSARFAAAGAAIALVAGYAFLHPLFRKLVQMAPADAADSMTLLAPMSIFLMGPVCFFSGILFTALGEQVRADAPDAASATGVLTLANTLGAMAGSLIAAFAMLPGVGLEVSFFVLALVYALIALVVPAPGAARLLRAAPAAAAALVLAVFPFGRMREAHYPLVEERFGARLVEAREGIAQSAFYLVHEFHGEPLSYRLVTNSYSMSGTAIQQARYMKLFAYLPAAFHPRIEDALVICFGVGVTASAVEDLPDVRAIDVVDVSRDILQMSDIAYPAPARHPLRDRRVSVHIEDGRFFLQHTARRYDLITGEPPPPKIAGVAPLYSKEYFRLLRERLKPGGLATYWLPVKELKPADALAIIRAFCDVFDDCSLWSGIEQQWVLMGSRGGVAPVSAAAFSRQWALPRTRESLREIALEVPEQMLAQFMADAAVLKALAADTAPLDDDHPRRISPARRTAPYEPLFAWLMQADRGRERFETSRWIARTVPVALAARSGARFRERGMLDEEWFAFLRRPDYSYWANLARLARSPDATQWTSWMLDSDARKLAIARRGDPADPVVAEQLAIEALATHRPPRGENLAREGFLAMTPRGQLVSVMRYCVAGEPRRARSLMAWIPDARRGEEPYRSFFAWAVGGCSP